MQQRRSYPPPLPVLLAVSLLFLPFCLPAQENPGRASDTGSTVQATVQAPLPSLRDSTPVSPNDNTLPTPLAKYGFGPELSFTGHPSFRIDTTGPLPGFRQQPSEPGQQPPDPGQSLPGLRTTNPAAWPLPYSVWAQQLLREPQSHTFWMRCGIQNNSATPLDLDIYCGSLNYTDAWWVSPGHPDQRVSGGNLRPPLSGSSKIQQQYNILPLTLGPHQGGQLFLAIRQRTRQYFYNGIGIYSPDALGAVFGRDYEDDYADLVFQWLFQGFLLCQLLYTLFQWLIIRRKEYLYYLGYLAAIALYFLSKYESELGLPLLFTRFPLLKVYLGKTLLILPYFLYFRFVRHFLEMPGQYPMINRWIVRMEYFLLFYLVFDEVFILLTFDQRTQTNIFTAILLLIFLTAASFIVYLFRHRRALIYYILAGSLFVAVGNILGQVFTWFQDNRHLHLGITNILLFPQAGVLLEILCFTAGLGYKNHMSEKEKIRGQERLIEQLKANELLQQRVQHIRNKIAQDLHDDIGSTLSSISILSDLALKDNSSGHTLETMNEIKDSSILLMERMDDIVWSINPRNDSLENLLIRVRHFATTLFEARDIEYTIDIQKNIHEVKLPMDYRQHIYLVLKEGINNLVKYAGATQAFLQVSFDHRHLELCVRDNGRGFLVSDASTGNGIPGMQRRADLMKADLTIVSTPGEGTAINLKVDLQ